MEYKTQLLIYTCMHQAIQDTCDDQWPYLGHNPAELITLSPIANVCLQHPKSHENCVPNTHTPTLSLMNYAFAPTSVKHIYMYMYIVHVKLM